MQCDGGTFSVVCVCCGTNAKAPERKTMFLTVSSCGRTEKKARMEPWHETHAWSIAIMRSSKRICSRLVSLL